MGAVTVTDRPSRQLNISPVRLAGQFFLAVGLADAMLLALLTLIWIFAPAQAPGLQSAALVPVLSLLLMVLPTWVHRGIPRAGRQSAIVAGAIRWWALLALLMSAPALLLIAAA